MNARTQRAGRGGAHHPGPDEEMIRAGVGERSYARGWAYFLGGALSDLRRSARGVRGRCEGSTDGPYTVRAGFGDNDGFAAECTCPVGAEGRCKHAAALLLAWSQSPDEFLVVPDVDAALARLESADELRVLLRSLRRRHPELEASLEELLARPGAQGPTASPRRAVAAVFRRHGGAPESTLALVDDLQALGRGADARALRGELDEACEVYRSIAFGVALRAARCVDDTGALRATALACLEKLAACLVALGESSRRARWRRAFCALAALDAEHDGPGFGELALRALARRGGPEDRRALGAWARARSEKTQGHARHAYVLLRAALGVEGCASLDEFVALCHEAGPAARRDLLAALLRAGREGAVKGLLGEASDELLVSLSEPREVRGEAPDDEANASAPSGAQQALCDELVRRLEGPRPSVRVLAWARRERLCANDRLGALALRARAVALRPDEHGFSELRAEALALGAWERVRTEVLGAIAARAGALAVEWWLGEGALDGALEASRTGRFEGAPAARVLLRLARTCAEHARPRDALQVFLFAAERAIDARGRANYREAASVTLEAWALVQSLAGGEATAGDDDGLRAQLCDFVARVHDEAREGPRKSAALAEEWSRVLAATRELAPERDRAGHTSNDGVR